MGITIFCLGFYYQLVFPLTCREFLNCWPPVVLVLWEVFGVWLHLGFDLAVIWLAWIASLILCWFPPQHWVFESGGWAIAWISFHWFCTGVFGVPIVRSLPKRTRWPKGRWLTVELVMLVEWMNMGCKPSGVDERGWSKELKEKDNVGVWVLPEMAVTRSIQRNVWKLSFKWQF